MSAAIGRMFLTNRLILFLWPTLSSLATLFCQQVTLHQEPYAVFFTLHILHFLQSLASWETVTACRASPPHALPEIDPMTVNATQYAINGHSVIDCEWSAVSYVVQKPLVFALLITIGSFPEGSKPKTHEEV